MLRSLTNRAGCSVRSSILVKNQRHPTWRVTRRHAATFESRSIDVGADIPLVKHTFHLGLILVIAIPAVIAFCLSRRNQRSPVEEERNRLTNVIAALPQTEFAVKVPLTPKDENVIALDDSAEGETSSSSETIAAVIEEERSPPKPAEDVTLESMINFVAEKTLESSRNVSRGKTVFLFQFDSEMAITAFSKKCEMVAMSTRRGILSNHDLYVCADNALCVKQSQSIPSLVISSEEAGSVLHNPDGVHGIIYEFDQSKFSRLFCGGNRILSERTAHTLTQMVERDGIPFDVAVQSLFRVQPIRVYNEDRNYADAGIDDHIQCVVFDQSAFFAEESRKQSNPQSPSLSSDVGSALVYAAMGGNLDLSYRKQLMQFARQNIDERLSNQLSGEELSEKMSSLKASVPKLSRIDICDRSDICVCNKFVLEMQESPFIQDPDWGFATDITLRIAAESSQSTLPSLLSVKNLSDLQRAHIDRFILDCAEERSTFAKVIGKVD